MRPCGNSMDSIWCEPCPEGTAGNDGECFECKQGTEPDHNKVGCVEITSWYGSDEFHAIMAVLGVLTGCGCVCGWIYAKVTKKCCFSQNT